MIPGPNVALIVANSIRYGIRYGIREATAGPVCRCAQSNDGRISGCGGLLLAQRFAFQLHLKTIYMGAGIS
jgi:hypothetical protein